MRKYERTHPWLRFSVDLGRANPELWMMLGECQSKCGHISGQPLRPDIAERLQKMYIAKGVLATTAIEGNTLSEDEVRNYLEGKLQLPPSREYLGQEISNIADECNRMLTFTAARKQFVLNTDKIKDLNRQVLKGLSLNEGVVPGEIRRYEVGVALYRGAPAEDCEYLLDRLCSWLNGAEFGSPSDSRGVVYAILKAILAHIYLAWIHPFGDGNGRTARLIEFQILIASGMPAPAAHLLSNHYNLTRTEYYRQLDRATKSGGDVIPFISYAVQGLVDGLRSQLEVIQEQVLHEVWRAYLHDQFLDKTSPADVRRRDLIEDLSRILEPLPIPISELDGLSPRMAKHYARKTIKTVTRDVNELARMGLIKVEDGAVQPLRENILAFLPARAATLLTARQRSGRLIRRKSRPELQEELPLPPVSTSV
jgi:Fic family protein